MSELLADRRHPLRFTLWVLLAIWVTATIAAGATYLISRGAESDEGHYRGHDYSQRSSCTHAPTRASMVDISGFKPLPVGDTTLITHAESFGKPALIYVWKGDSGCVSEWARDTS